MNSKTILFIINKFAGGGFQPQVEGKILDICERYNTECTIEFTRSRGHATELAKEGIEKRFNKIVAVGGDGTVNEVARGLVGTGISMGIVPKGSGNGLGRHLGLPLKFEEAVQNTFTGKPLAIDTFIMNGHLSLNVSGVGFDGHIANLFGKDGKRGLVGYTKLALKEFLSFREFPATIIVDGISYTSNAFIVAIANSSQYGNNARIAPSASVTDQKLHVTLLKKVPIYQGLAFIIRFFSGKVQSSTFCETYNGKHIELRTNNPIPFHIDGEPCGADSNFVSLIQPKSLQLIVPETVSHV